MTIITEFNNLKTEKSKIAIISSMINEVKLSWPSLVSSEEFLKLVQNAEQEIDFYLISMIYFYKSDFQNSFEFACKSANLIDFEKNQSFTEFIISSLILRKEENFNKEILIDKTISYLKLKNRKEDLIYFSAELNRWETILNLFEFENFNEEEFLKLSHIFFRIYNSSEFSDKENFSFKFDINENNNKNYNYKDNNKEKILLIIIKKLNSFENLKLSENLCESFSHKKLSSKSDKENSLQLQKSLILSKYLLEIEILRELNLLQEIASIISFLCQFDFPFTFSLALQISSNLSETEHPIILNTIIQLFLSQCKKYLSSFPSQSSENSKEKEKERKRMKNFLERKFKIVEFLSKTFSYFLNSLTVQMRSISERKAFSSIKQICEKAPQIDLFSIVAYTFQNASTLSVDFLNNRSEWLSSQKLWSSYTAISSLGTLFKETTLSKGNFWGTFFLFLNSSIIEIQKKGLENLFTSKSIKNNFDNNSQKNYFLGGVLQALGMICVGKPLDEGFYKVVEILERLLHTDNGITQYGACMGLGLLFYMNGFCSFRTLSSYNNENEKEGKIENAFIKQFEETKKRIKGKLKEKIKENNFEIGCAAAIGFGLLSSADFIYSNCSSIHENKNEGNEINCKCKELKSEISFLFKSLKETENSLVKKGLSISISILNFKLYERNSSNLKLFSLSKIKEMLKENETEIKIAAILNLSMAFASSKINNLYEPIEIIIELLEKEFDNEIIFSAIISLSFILSSKPNLILEFLDVKNSPKHYNFKFKAAACLSLAFGALFENDKESENFKESFSTIKKMCKDDNKIVASLALLSLGLCSVNFPEIKIPNELLRATFCYRSKEVLRMGAILGFAIKKNCAQNGSIFSNSFYRKLNGNFFSYRKELNTYLGLLFLSFFSKWFPFLSLFLLALDFDYSVILEVEKSFKEFGNGLEDENNERMKIKLPFENPLISGNGIGNEEGKGRTSFYEEKVRRELVKRIKKETKDEIEKPKETKEKEKEEKSKKDSIQFNEKNEILNISNILRIRDFGKDDEEDDSYYLGTEILRRKISGVIFKNLLD